MKIQPGMFPRSPTVQRPEPQVRPPASMPFADVMREQQERHTQEELKRRIEDIKAQGERLARNMTVRELKIYRQMVKDFLDLTLRRGIGLKETRGWDRRGRGRRYKLLEEVDAILVQLGEELLRTEEGRLELLRRVGEIRGLLINLAF